MIYLKSKEGEAKFILSDRSGTESVVNFIKKSMKNEQFSVLDDLVLEPEVSFFLFGFFGGFSHF